MQKVATCPPNRAEGDVDRFVYSHLFAKEPAGVFVDVGSARPDYLSISALFREKGWRVIAIEPNPIFADIHRKLGHEIYEVACGAEDRDGVEFCVVDSHGAPYEGGKVSFESHSSLSIKDGYAKFMLPSFSVSKIIVPLRRLDTILAEAGLDHIDVLSIDVEGWELEVLKGLDIDRFRPGVMILENLLGEPEYEAKAEAAGYRLWKSLPPNQVFLRSETFSRLPLLQRIAGVVRSSAAKVRRVGFPKKRD